MKRIAVIFAFSLCLHHFEKGFSQSENQFSRILKTVFENKDIFPKVHVNIYKDSTAIYIHSENRLDSYLDDYLELYRRMSTSRSSITLLFKTDLSSVNIFLNADILNGFTEYKTDKVVVVDKFRISKHYSTLVFHTTNLDSNEWHAKVNPMPKFYKFKCHLALNGSEWIVKKVEISDYGFKSIVY